MGRGKKNKQTEANKENVGESLCESPAVKKGLEDMSRNWEEEMEAMRMKLMEMKLQKEQVEKLVHVQEEKIKEQHDKILEQSKKQEQLQDKLKKLQKRKEFQPVLSIPLLDESAGDAKVKKKKNDPDRIKRPLLPFILWSNDNREKIRADNPTLGMKEIAGKLGELWKTVSDEEKKPYEEAYQKSKEEYLKLVGAERREAEALKLLQEEKCKKMSMELMQQYLEYKKTTEAEKKKAKDPEQPKKPISAYMAYCEQRRPALMTSKIKVPEMGKILGEEWRNMDQQARAPYVKIALEAKTAYLGEMEAYKRKKAEEAELAEKAEQEQAKRERICALELLKQKEKEQEVMKAAKAAKAPRKAKVKSHEPGQPKKPASAYILFGMEYRKRLQTEMPIAKFPEINALIANRWKEMTPEERQKYVDKAAVEKLKYQQAMEEFKRLHPDTKDEATTSLSSTV